MVSGEILVASCQANANPLPVIKWFREDQLLSDGDQTPDGVSISQSNESTTTSSQLTVTGFTSKEAGVYSCVAVNDFGNDSRSFQVHTVGESAACNPLFLLNLNAWLHVLYINCGYVVYSA